MMMPDKHSMNHLVFEKSPYLLQHAHNPVHWYAWGDDAFQKAQKEDKPLFVSIGYSTCHWCHVMAHESFEDEDVAAMLNEHFVSVKVDREERPDVDAVYMAACQAMTGSGGWPLSVFMDADQVPFFVGTYFPKHARYGHPGLMDILSSLSRQWRSNRSQLLEAGQNLIDHISAQSSASPCEDQEPVTNLMESGVSLFAKMFDVKNGGFGSAPKFPTPHNLLFLMRYAALTGDKSALNMASQTLTQMARGGIFDHIGGGFSRYSTDAKWLIPHFEKMLYDNALLGHAYTTAAMETKSDFFKQAAVRTYRYVLDELAHADGGFFCGQDADSDGVEGKYYVFTPDEIDDVLGDADGPWFCRVYDITRIGNFEGSSVPNLLKYAEYQSAWQQSEPLLEKLYAYRKTRTALHLDDKIITSWNALMIVSLCHASCVFENDEYLSAAKGAAAFIHDKLKNNKGRLYVRWRDGEAKHDGHIDDYAFYAYALLALYQATWDIEYLRRAIDISKAMLSLFFDESEGGFYLYARDAQRLILRPKEVYDGAMPCGNSVAALVLGRLFKLTGEIRWQQAYDKQMRFLTANIQSRVVGHSFSLFAMTEAVYPSYELVCACAEGYGDDSALNALKGSQIPNLTVLVKTNDNAKNLSPLAPWTANYPVPKDGIMYYLCKGGACDVPTDDRQSILEAVRHTK